MPGLTATGIDGRRHRAGRGQQGVAPGGVAGVGRVANLKVIGTGRGAMKREHGVGKMVVIGGGELAARAVVKRQDRVEVFLEVVDLVFETVAPDLKADALAFRQLDGNTSRHPRPC